MKRCKKIFKVIFNTEAKLRFANKSEGNAKKKLQAGKKK